MYPSISTHRRLHCSDGQIARKLLYSIMLAFRSNDINLLSKLKKRLNNLISNSVNVQSFLS